MADVRQQVMDVHAEVVDEIEAALDAVRPALLTDGGNVEFVDFDADSGVVFLRMLGACGGCPMSIMTLKMGIERMIRQRVPAVRTVEAI